MIECTHLPSKTEIKLFFILKCFRYLTLFSPTTIKHNLAVANQDAGRNCTLDAEKPKPAPPPKAQPASDDIDPDDELAMWEGAATFSVIVI